MVKGCRGAGGVAFEWTLELFDDKVGDRGADDSDGSVFVGEAMLNPKPRLKSSSVAENDLDGDWVALDGGPDKSVEIENSNASDSEDLLARTTWEIPRGAKEIGASDVVAPRMEAISCY
ncbi:hypothetical protein U1Q18_048215 [Sarracenia purpurea var. burkii]